MHHASTCCEHGGGNYIAPIDRGSNARHQKQIGREIILQHATQLAGQYLLVVGHCLLDQQ